MTKKDRAFFYKGASLPPWGPFLIFAVNWTPSASKGKNVAWFILPMHLQSSVSSKSLGQAAPKFTGCLTMSFVLFLVPPPQVRLHGVQEDHSSTSQSTPRVSCSSRGSRGKIVSWFRLPMHLQSSVSSKSLGQAAPKFTGCLTMSFVLFLVPPPQVRLHGVQEDHSSTSQSTPRVSCSSRG